MLHPSSCCDVWCQSDVAKTIVCDHQTKRVRGAAVLHLKVLLSMFESREFLWKRTGELLSVRGVGRGPLL
eukprot:7350080-Pyramimonas_sp.AAC.1